MDWLSWLKAWLEPIRPVLKPIKDWFVGRWNQKDDFRRPGFRTGVALLALLGGFATWKDVSTPPVAKAAELHFLRDHCWITYDPTALNPLTLAGPSSPSG